MSRIKALTRIRPTSSLALGDKVYGQLCGLLMAGSLAPGEKLSLRTTAEALGVSMMPVRAAVSRLVADRALVVAPNRAVHVPILSIEQFRELAAIRIEIEGFAAKHAATAATEEDLTRISAAETAFRGISLSQRPNLREAVQANKKFHFAVYRATGLSMLGEIIGGLANTTRRNDRTIMGDAA